MSGGKETPRQKMIGMMYLFYTALLALNVSADILNAFVLVNDSMTQTNNNFGKKNEVLMTAFANQNMNNPKKVKPYYDKAKEVKRISDILVADIRHVIDTLIIVTEFGSEFTQDFVFEVGDDRDTIIDFAHNIPVAFLTAKDKFNTPMRLLNPEHKIEYSYDLSQRLKNKFAAYNKEILNMLSDEDKKTIQLGLNTEEVYNSIAREWQDWEYNSFYHTVLVADIVLLNKYVSEVLNTEAEVIGTLYSYIDAKSLKFDAIRAAVIPVSNVVIAGSDYEADIFVAAYSATEIPKVSIKTGADTMSISEISNDGIIQIHEATNGITKFKVKTGATGEFTYAGYIQMKDADGNYKPYYFNSSYQVIKPTATVSADAVNVVYRGIPNPLSASAPGFTNDKIRLGGGSGGKLVSKGGGHYMFTPDRTRRKDVKFSVNATKGDGSTQNMGSFTFRVLPVPPAVVRLAGINEGSVSKGALKSQGFLTAKIENFLFDLPSTVVEFRIMVTGGSRGMLVNKKVKGNKIPADVIKKIYKAPKGSMVLVNSIKTRGKDGIKEASSITLTLK